MVVSYTLARVVPAQDKAVYRELNALDVVKEVVLAYGVFDMMITIETENIEELDHIVFNKIRKIEGIVSTTTLIGAGKKE
jgi:DNA-binding Lrp family transcriptional regulator